MSFKDLASRMKAAQSAQKAEERSRPFDAAESFRLRGKMLGVLIRDARVNVDRSVEDVAKALQIVPQTVEAWEFGDLVPSLPELELLATYLDVPVSHFWSMETLEATRKDRKSAQQTFTELRHRMIGALLRQARETQDMSVEDLAAASHLTTDEILSYELGEVPIPMHILTTLAGAVKQNVSYFLETESQIGEMLASLEAWKHFNDLPEDLRSFAANPLNIGFIEIALAFSQMENDRLKRIAVSMLDITGY